MLEKYKDEFPNFYKQISLAINENRISHAYLIEVGNYDNYIDIIKSMVVDILNQNNDTVVDYKKMIVNDMYSDFVVISPQESRWIKKEQILNLQSMYKTKSTYNNKRVYIIDKADDLNQSSANTLLKFLEEPKDDIIGILIARNKYNVIPTVFSRCQLVVFDKKETIETHNIQNKVVEFLSLVNKKRKKVFPYLKKLDYNIENKDDLVVLIEEVIRFYQDTYRYVLGKKLLYYNDFNEEIKDFSNGKDIQNITGSLIKIEDLYKNFQFNINVRLLLDKLVMIIVGVDMDV